MAQSANKRTYYKRALPSPPAIAFSSAEGREIFSEALPLGTMVGFFKLIEQFTTQEEPQYCGLAALSMTLNALGIDPRRTWKGAWRWFSETMLDCCKSMEDIKRDGITLSQAACLARCNGADVSVHRHGSFDGLTFRRLLREVCASEDVNMVVAYSRKTFHQSGDGHFSPIGGYNAQRDMVLILDVARFKYSPHWVRVDELMEAMGLLDPAIGRPRGFLLMSSRRPRESALFSLDLDLDRGAGLGLELGLGPSTADALVTPCAAVAQQPSCNRTARGVACPSGTGTEPVALRLRDVAAADCSSYGDGSGSGAAPGPRWAAAHRFVTREGPALLRRLLAEPHPHEPAEAGDGQEGDADEHGDEEEEGAKSQGEDAATSVGGVGSSSGAAAVPSVESLLGSLVAAAPLESVCALLVRRPPLASVGELRRGPCCCCCLGAGAAAAGGDAAPEGATTAREQRHRTAAAATAAAASPFVILAPCNSGSVCLGRSGGGAGRPPGRQHLLTEAAVEAAGAGGCGGGTLASGVEAAARGCGASSTRCSPVVIAAAPGTAAAAAAAEEGAAASGLAGVGKGRMGNVSGGSSTSLSLRFDACSLDSAGASDGSLSGSIGSGHSSCSSGSCGGDRGSSSGSSGGGSSCCHGEPLEHHCVPPQVQALVADELRFTNMFKLVDYWLRRHRGCNHVHLPDLTKFMRPAGAAAAPTKPAVAATGSNADSGNETASAATATAAAAAAAKSSAPAAATSAGDSGCDCDLGLPELAAEKLTVALLMMSEGDGWPGQQLQVQRHTPGAAPTALGAAAAAVWQCGRPRCRKCRQRAADAGDRAAALELLREEWRQLLRMAPLGLFASAPVMQDEVSYLRLQLDAAGQQRGAVEGGMLGS